VRNEVESLLADIGPAKDVRATALPYGDQQYLEIGIAIACRRVFVSSTSLARE
jgi:hypothetical protein